MAKNNTMQNVTQETECKGKAISLENDPPPPCNVTEMKVYLVFTQTYLSSPHFVSSNNFE